MDGPWQSAAGFPLEIFFIFHFLERYLHLQQEFEADASISRKQILRRKAGMVGT
jgi:hypothetical protein